MNDCVDESVMSVNEQVSKGVRIMSDLLSKHIELFLVSVSFNFFMTPPDPNNYQYTDSVIE